MYNQQTADRTLASAVHGCIRRFDFSFSILHWDQDMSDCNTCWGTRAFAE